MSNRICAFIAALLATLLIAGGVYAAEKKPAPVEKEKIVESYAVPDYREIIQSMVVLGGYDINDIQVADAYGQLVYCDVYRKYFSNDFEWNNIRRQMIGRVLQKKEMYRVQYEYQELIKLDRYSFEKQVFPLTRDTRMSNVATLQLISNQEANIAQCRTNKKEDPFFPVVVYLRFARPLTLTELRMPQEEAEALLNKLKVMRVGDRSLHVRFRFRVVDVPRMALSKGGNDKPTGQINAQMQAADFYLDKELTMKVTSIQFD